MAALGLLAGAHAADAAGGATRSAPTQWRTTIELPGIGPLAAGKVAHVDVLVCPSAGNCSAGGSYSGRRQGAFLASEVNGRWERAAEVRHTATQGTSKFGSGVTAISCTSAGSCVAGGYVSPNSSTTRAFVVAEVGGHWGLAQPLHGVADGGAGSVSQVQAIACASVGNCLAAGQYTATRGFAHYDFVAIEARGVWQPAIELPGSRPRGQVPDAAVSSASCAPNGDCVVAGSASTPVAYSRGFLDEERGGQWQPVVTVSGSHVDWSDVDQVRCFAPGSCVAWGAYVVDERSSQFILNEVGGRWSHVVPVAGFAGLNRIGQTWGWSFSCAAPGYCTAGGAVARSQHVYSYVISQRAGRWLPASPLAGTVSGELADSALGGLSAISCAHVGDCTAGGSIIQSGQLNVFIVKEGNGIWHLPTSLPGLAQLESPTVGGSKGAQVGEIACPTPERCTVMGSYSTPHGSSIWVTGEI